MKKLLLTIAIIFSNLFAYSQTISGTITDLNTQESLIGVNIILENGSGTASDISGAYTIKTNAGKKGNLIIEDGMALLGFGPRTIATAIKASKKITNQNEKVQK